MERQRELDELRGLHRLFEAQPHRRGFDAHQALSPLARAQWLHMNTMLPARERFFHAASRATSRVT
jgi:hypothetical protein